MLRIPSQAEAPVLTVYLHNSCIDSIMPCGYSRMSSAELHLARRLQAQDKSVSEIARILGRDKGTVSLQLNAASSSTSSARKRKSGRQPALTAARIDRLESKVNHMTKIADAEYQVTVKMIKQALGLKCCERVVLNALHSRGIYLHPLREKPVRTPEDVHERKVFADAHKEKSAGWWSNCVHAYLDNKFFPVYTTGKSRSYAAKRVARGTFRKVGEGLARGHVKPKKNLKFNTGARSQNVAAAISSKKVLMFHIIDGQWNGQAASDMYRSKLAPAMRKEYPSKRRFLLLEDNDPSGYKSTAGKAAKAAMRMDVLALPRRSPDLNPLDYGFWSEVSRRMRKQEKKFPRSFRETQQDYAVRLRRTALRIPSSYLDRLVRSMKRKCVALSAAAGNDFQELCFVAASDFGEDFTRVR